MKKRFISAFLAIFCVAAFSVNVLASKDTAGETQGESQAVEQAQQLKEQIQTRTENQAELKINQSDAGEQVESKLKVRTNH